MFRHSCFATILPFLVLACSDQASVLEPRALLVHASKTAAAAGKDTPVKSELLGGGSGANRNIQSDGVGAYQNGMNGVSSILQVTLGDWVLDLTARQSNRAVRIDFSDSLPANPYLPPFVSALLQARFIAKASQLNSGGFAGMVGLGSTMLSPLAVGEINYGGKTYAIRMNPSSHPGTDWVLVTCTAVAIPSTPATSACSKWEITPSGYYNGVAKNVGYLEQVATTSTFIGLYYFTFDIIIAK